VDFAFGGADLIDSCYSPGRGPRNGTNPESLPQVHDSLKSVTLHVSCERWRHRLAWTPSIIVLLRSLPSLERRLNLVPHAEAVSIRMDPSLAVSTHLRWPVGPTNQSQAHKEARLRSGSNRRGARGPPWL